MTAWFYAVDAEGNIVRFGMCRADEAVDQAGPGEIVLAFASDPGFTDTTHVVDLESRTFHQLN